jgi:hypothetical protein
MLPTEMLENKECEQLQLLLQHKEDQLSLAIHLANANAVPLCRQMMEILSEFLHEKLSLDVSVKQWIEEMTRSRQQEQVEEMKSRYSKSLLSCLS